jgi:gliding motility-associated-like protein
MGETAISTIRQDSLRINQGFHQVGGCVFFGEIFATSVQLDCNTPEIVLRHGFGEVGWEWIDSKGMSLGSEDSIVLNTPGIYSIELEKDLCTDKVSIEIIQDTTLPSLPEVISDTIDCITGEATIQTIGMVGDSLWQWYDPAQEPLQGDTVLLVDTPGEYTLVVTGQNGCRDSISVEVYESTDAPQLTLETDGALNCILDTITLQATSSTPGVLIFWLNPAGDSLVQAEVTSDTAGRWEVFVKNPENGCITREVYEIIIDTALPAYSLEGDTLNCRQTAIDLRVNYSDTASALYTWSSPTDEMVEGNLPEFTISAPGLWKLTLTNLENGCAKTDSIYIVGDFEQPEVSAGHDPIACLDESVRLWGESSDIAEAMDWFGPSGHLVGKGSEVIVSVGGTYRLQVTALNGCTADKVVEVSLWKWDLLPTVFTPNGDGRNDLLVLSPCEDTNILPNIDLIVFNRWGQEVFQRKGYQHDWDGTHNGRLVPTGQYYYIVRLNDEDIKKPLTIIY